MGREKREEKGRGKVASEKLILGKCANTPSSEPIVFTLPSNVAILRIDLLFIHVFVLHEFPFSRLRVSSTFIPSADKCQRDRFRPSADIARYQSDEFRLGSRILDKSDRLKRQQSIQLIGQRTSVASYISLTCCILNNSLARSLRILTFTVLFRVYFVPDSPFM